MADKEWVRVYATDQPHKAGIVKAFLEDNQINTVVVNKKDSSYTFIGDIELYTASEDALLATTLIKVNEL
ncbi:MAG TPA: DUF2007 domain-containing protein [Bacteroidia bacterium]|nr:DUF2007 domain-containing protein [Bacteroidia bacterium]